MATAGFVFLVLAFIAIVASVVALLVGEVLARAAQKSSKAERAERAQTAANVSRIGRLAAAVTTVALFLCCAILVVCFMTNDVSILYVLQERSLSTSSLAWLYKLSGLWAGRAGSLLFWAFLISLFALVMLIRARKDNDRMDNMALLVMQVVLAAFTGVLVFSQANMPFSPTPSSYFQSDGSLTASASLYSMNQLLEHWAMAIHPPTLFVGYAGLTVPFAFAVAALIVDDPSAKWVERATHYALFSWLFLGIGIGLGSVWAYVVLGWGGYWGWDAVENASLLSWLVSVALIHTFTVYRQRGAFKRWAILCACLAFAFVIVGTFISRSGIVQSVHAFEGDPVSLALFGFLIVAAVVVGIAGLAVRWKHFAADTEGADDVESLMSKDGAYYFNNVIMVVFTLILTYMTVCSALPSWLPFGGQSLSKTSYDAIAHPLGIFYLLILAVCPLLGWDHTDKKRFWRQARIPGICAIVLFAILMAYFATTLVPAYQDTLAQGGSQMTTLLEAGPEPYYLGLTVVGFLVASLLFFNALFMLVRGIGNYAKAHEVSVGRAIGGVFKHHASTYGGSIAHIAMAIILVGLIGSSMYVTERTGYMAYDQDTNTASQDFTIEDYTLKFKDQSIQQVEQSHTVFYEVTFDVYKGDSYVGTVSPQVQLDAQTQQQKLNASVISFPNEDLFVVYKGVNTSGAFSLDVRVNRLIGLVWGGFILLMIGTLVALVAGHPTKRKADPAPAGKPAAEDKPASAEKPASKGKSTTKGKPAAKGALNS